MLKHVKKLRINITITSELLKRIDNVATKYERSRFINEACVEKLDRDKVKK
mgnify:CR=1 FL=1|jgi:metal-responsive CopG/Arc/MetJ family transcriptional regulator|tara:strand:+ start:626 stop:778 length:153 start_codon:yes stop_codon:yes gene_type:complete